MNLPQDIGDEFEKSFAKKIGAKIQPGSGNQWFAKMDLSGNGMLWSLKATKHASFRVTTDMLKEVIDAAQGPGGTGGDVVPAMAIQLAGEEFVVLRANDFIHLVQEDVKVVASSKRDKKFANAKIPKLLREEE